MTRVPTKPSNRGRAPHLAARKAANASPPLRLVANGHRDHRGRYHRLPDVYAAGDARVRQPERRHRHPAVPVVPVVRVAGETGPCR